MFTASESVDPVKSRWVLAAVSMALFCVQIDYFAANLALPRMTSEVAHIFPVSASHAIGLAYGIAGLGNATGPLIGGMLTDAVGWRSSQSESACSP